MTESNAAKAERLAAAGATATQTAPPRSLDDVDRPDEAEDQALAEAEARANALEAEAIARQRELDAQAARIRELEGLVQTHGDSLTMMDADGRGLESLNPEEAKRLAQAARPAEEGGMFTAADAYRPWRARSANGSFTGITEGLQFANGTATISALPPGASAGRVAVRVLRLNNLRNYDFYTRDLDPRARRLVTHRHVGYEVLTPEQYEAKYPQGDEDGEELPEGF